MNSDISLRGREKNIFTGVGLVVQEAIWTRAGATSGCSSSPGRTTAEAVNNSMWDWIRPPVGRCSPSVGVYHGCG